MSRNNLNNPPTGPSYTPISLQMTSEPFLSSETTLNLLITPQPTSSASTVYFTVHFYTVASVTPSGPNAVAQFDELPQPASYYFDNIPAQIPLYGNNASCSIHVLPTISELAGQTLVVTVTSSESGSGTAATTIPVVASAVVTPMLKAA
ncbi:MAG: hypothetical protein QM758_11495 [Armatimonas sp.]